MSIFDPAFLAACAIVAAVVIGVVQQIKKWLKLEGITAVIISLIITVVAALPSIGEGKIYFAFLVIVSFLMANGWYKVVAKKK